MDGTADTQKVDESLLKVPQIQGELTQVSEMHGNLTEVYGQSYRRMQN